MIECSSCYTLNPELEASCLACGHALGRSAAVTRAAFGGDRCPEGHPVDPSWKSCPYCERLQAGGAGARQPTRLDGEPTAPSASFPTTRLDGDGSAARRTRLDGEPPQTVPAIGPPTYRPTRIEPPSEPAGGRRTFLQPSAGPDSKAVVPLRGGSGQPGLAPITMPLPARRLLAVLAAPDLGPAGGVFAVRAGKNTLGADRTNDIVIGADSEVSAEHAVILHRNGAFTLADRLSTNGTWVNGEEVPTNGTRPLYDRDRIRCGGTELQFLILDPTGGETADLS